MQGEPRDRGAEDKPNGRDGDIDYVIATFPPNGGEPGADSRDISRQVADRCPGLQDETRIQKRGTKCEQAAPGYDLSPCELSHLSSNKGCDYDQSERFKQLFCEAVFNYTAGEGCDSVSTRVPMVPLLGNHRLWN